MYTIKREVSVEVMPTPWELANVFCDMDADEQAEFFNFIEQLAAEWTYSLANQLQGVTDSKKLTQSGRFVMGAIGEYAEEQND